MVANKKIIIGIFLIIACVIGNSTISMSFVEHVYIEDGATSSKPNDILDIEEGEGNSTDLGININKFKPVISNANNAISVVNSILGIMIVIGIIATVVSLAVIGFSAILGSANDKAVAQEKYMGVVIGAIFITGVSLIAKLIISIAEKI